MRKSRSPVLKGFVILIGAAVVAGIVYYRSQPVLSPDRLAAVENRVWDNTFRVPADSGLARVRSIAESLDLPSVSFAVAVDGRVVWEAAVGWADLSDQLGASPDTRYRTGSVAKAITSVILGRLARDGTIDLDSPVRKYVPEAVGTAGDATIRQLASHMGGIRHYANAPSLPFLRENFTRKHYETAGAALGLFIEDSVLFAPGTGFNYSTWGYTLLGAALEAASGRPYATLLEDEVVEPAHLEHTGPDDVTLELPLRAVTYVQLGDRYVDPPDADPSYKWPGGGLLSTPADLARFGGALMAGDLLDDGMLEQLWTPQRMPDGSVNPENYGMGWRIDLESGLIARADTVRVIHHGGTSPGGSAFLLLVPADRVAVAVMTNRSLANAGPLRREAYWAAGAFARANDHTRRSMINGLEDTE